jgi:hypothetical protein
VIFTSVAEEQGAAAAGDWAGIHFGSETLPGSSLANVQILYAGDGGQPALEILQVPTGRIALSDVVIDQTSSGGIEYLYEGGSFASYQNVALKATGAWSLHLQPELIQYLSGTGNQVASPIWIAGGDVNTSVAWPKWSVPYEVRGDVYVRQSATLTLLPGTTLQFAPAKGLYVGYSIYQGGLNAVGTSSEKIVFTAASASGVQDYWKGIVFDDSALTSKLGYCTMRYAGNPSLATSGVVEVDYGIASSISITNTTFADNAGSNDIAITERFGGAANHCLGYTSVASGNVFDPALLNCYQ